MLGLVEECGAAGGMTWREDDLYLSAAKVYHLAIASSSTTRKWTADTPPDS